MKEKNLTKEQIKMFNLGIIHGKKILINSILDRKIITEDKKDEFIRFVLLNLN